MDTKIAGPNDLVVALRQKTGAGMMDCKRAITEANGDFDKALDILRKKGLADAAKKSARTAKEGTIAGAISPDGKSAALVELNCETDFVAKNADFQAFASTLAADAAADKIRSPEDAAERVQSAISKFGENTAMRRLVRYELKGPGTLAFYIHPSGRKQGALVELGAANEAAAGHEESGFIARELLLQIVAMSPRWVRAADVPQDMVGKERDIYATQLKNEGKPEAAIPKIVEGKLQKLFFQAFCLLEQVGIRDSKTPVKKLVEEAGAKAGGAFTVSRFVRYQVGEE